MEVIFLDLFCISSFYQTRRNGMHQCLYPSGISDHDLTARTSSQIYNGIRNLIGTVNRLQRLYRSAHEICCMLKERGINRSRKHGTNVDIWRILKLHAQAFRQTDNTKLADCISTDKG